ncbi:MAG TPA: S41 family peptidase [Candidatus Polarisedimenticolia bacterium]|nr:S41 family peptidase [Candidatus Polarisedimenticolia bacterium]
MPFRRLPPVLLLLVAAGPVLFSPVPRASARSAEPEKPEKEGPAVPDPIQARQNAAIQAAVNNLVQEGNKHRQEGRLPAALDAYRSAASLDPSRYEIRILVADTLRRLGRVNDAVQWYRKATALAPGRAEGYTGQAILRRTEYDYDGAAALLLPGLEKATGADRADLLVTLGETRRRQGSATEARARFQEAVELDPSNASAHAGLARMAEERGDLDGAIASWDRFRALEPDDLPSVQRRQELVEMRAVISALADAAKKSGSGTGSVEVWSELGRLRTIAGDSAGAAEAYRAALKRVPKDADARRGLALALEASGDTEGAAIEFRRLLEAVPTDATALYHQAALARRRGDAAAEEAAWGNLVARRPDDLYAARALCAFVERQGTGARDRALAAVPPGLAGLRRRALLLASADAWPEVEAALDAALRIDATDPWTLDVLSDLLARRPEMLAHLAAGVQKELQAGGGDPTAALLVLARCHLLAGHQPEARSILERVAQARPTLAVARSALAETMQGPGRDPQGAVAALEKAIALDPSRLAPHVDLGLLLLRSRRPKEAEAAARRGLEKNPGAAPLLSLLGAARADQGDAEGAARQYALALLADPADNFHLARGQTPALLASLGRTFEARRALRGTLPELGDLAYLEAWGFARDSFRDRARLGPDYDAARARFRELDGTPAAAHRAIAVLLQSLGDPYTRLRDPEETAAVWLTRHQGTAAGRDALGRNVPGGATVTTGDLPGNLGYVQIANFTDPNAVRELKKALAALGDKSGIVIDLRGNTGGLTKSADEVADLLIGPGADVGSESGPEGTAERVTGGDGAATRQPLTVLVDGQTASAAERLAGSLEASGRAEVVGDPTYGKGLFQTSRVLPGGYMVLVSTGETLDRDGAPMQGRGVRVNRAPGPLPPAAAPIPPPAFSDKPDPPPDPPPHP